MQLTIHHYGWGVECCVTGCRAVGLMLAAFSIPARTPAKSGFNLMDRASLQRVEKSALGQNLLENC